MIKGRANKALIVFWTSFCDCDAKLEISVDTESAGELEVCNLPLKPHSSQECKENAILLSRTALLLSTMQETPSVSGSRRSLDTGRVDHRQIACGTPRLTLHPC